MDSKESNRVKKEKSMSSDPKKKKKSVKLDKKKSENPEIEKKKVENKTKKCCALFVEMSFLASEC
jgi:hypothetical protein